MSGIANMTPSELRDYAYTLEGRIRGLEAEVDRQSHLRTHIPPAVVDRADLVAEEATLVADRGINWRGREAQLTGYGLAGGSAGDRRAIVQFFAALERRRMETGSLD